MKPLNFQLGTLNLRCAVVALVLIACNDCTAQIQQAWVARYNNGITSGKHQAVKMALDSAGNIYVTGFSQNTNTNLGYVTIKYAPNSNQLWATRYDSTNYPTASPVAMIIDSSNNVVITGSALTIKYDSNGNQLWTAPYAGMAVGCDPTGDAYVTGFGTNFNTIKLAPTGSNLWLTTYIDVGPTIGEAVAVDTNGNVYVSGSDTYYYIPGQFAGGPYVTLTTIMYASNGSQIWKASQAPTSANGSLQVQGVALDSVNNLYLVANFFNLPSFDNPSQGFNTYKYSSNGSLVWTSNPASNNGNNTPHDLVLNSSNNILLVGRLFHMANTAYGTFELSTNGTTMWEDLYPPSYSGTGGGMGIAVDSANNSYVTGYSPGTNSTNDIVTIAYGPNGNQLWLQRYASPDNGNAAGNAITVDNNGNVYVAGYDTTTAGGTEMVLIKYSPVTLQKGSNGSFILYAQGSPGESFDIQASADLQNWLDLGSVTADTNGLMQYADTNASNFPSRFYYTNPQ